MIVGRVRPTVAALSAYRPGKGAKQAAVEHGLETAIKLASNETPLDPIPAVVAAITEAASGVNRYGDHRASELRERLAAWLGVETDMVAVGCGSVGLLQQLCLAYLDAGDEVVCPWPSFEAYPINVRLMNANLVEVPLVEQAFDLDAVVNAVTSKTKLILLATPNNPTGTAVSTTQLRAMLDRVPADVVVLIDEAYHEFCGPDLGDSIKELMPDYPNVVVSRTFSKAYGLAGLRTGYLVAHPSVVTQLDKVLLAFAVNSVAQAASLAVLDHLDEFGSRIDGVLKERDRVVAALNDSGWQLPDAQANFVYLETGSRTDELHLAMEQRGVVTRPFSGQGIRVTIGTPAENNFFLETLAAVSG